MSKAAPSRSPGRPAGATPEAVLALVVARLARGEMPDVSQISAAIGVGRTTIYRWFGDRDGLVGEALSAYLDDVLERGYRRTRARGGRRVGRAIASLIRPGAANEAFLGLLRSEPEAMLRIIMAPHGRVQQRSIASVESMIEREQAAGRYKPVLDPNGLAFVLVQVGQSFLWARAATGLPPDIEQTMRVTDALLAAERE